jgi:erythritol kinase
VTIGSAPASIGIDVGTSMTKAVLFDGSGRPIAGAERPTRIYQPRPDRAEHDIDEVVAGAGAVIAELVHQVPGTVPLLLSVTGQGDGCWLVDEDARSVGPAVSWMDGRAARVVDGWAEDGTAETVYRANGNAIFPGSHAAILRWMDEHAADQLDRAATASYCKDVVFQRFTGIRATDPSEASLPFGLPDGSGYSDELLAACGLGHRAELLAPVVRPLPAAPLAAAGAAMTGLREGTPVVSGPFDLAASPIGAGVRRPGDGLLIIGTTLGCEVLVDRLDVSGEVTGMHLATATAGQWVRVLPAMAGCAALDWALELVGMTAAQVSGAIEQSQPGAGGVEVLPYLAPSGERAPFVDPAASGQVTGLRVSTTSSDIIRAVCEGIAFAARDCFESTEITGRLAVGGGGAKSRAWLQIFADVLQRPLCVSGAPAIGARGAVLAALAAMGTPVDVEEWTRPEEVVEPDATAAGRYDELFGRYLRHRRTARSLWVRA